MKKCIIFIVYKAYSIRHIFITLGRRARNNIGYKEAGQVISLAAFAFAIFSFPQFLQEEDSDYGQGAPYFSFYENYASSLIEDEETEDFPELPTNNILSYTVYTVEKGDTISGISQKLGINQDSIISCNNIERARSLQIGTMLLIPNMNGIMHLVKAGDTPEKIAETYKITVEQLFKTNNMNEFTREPGEKIFIPGARLSSLELRRIWGELFRYPLRGRVTSGYGYRSDPITGRRNFHTGIDIAGSHGTPVRAAMEGRVIQTGSNDISGNFVIVAHAGGYVSSYAHMSLISVKTGQWVTDGQRLGDVGSTGYSTGPHLHFSISRWGKTINPVLLLY